MKSLYVLSLVYSMMLKLGDVGDQLPKRWKLPFANKVSPATMDITMGASARSLKRNTGTNLKLLFSTAWNGVSPGTLSWLFIEFVATIHIHLSAITPYRSLVDTLFMIVYCFWPTTAPSSLALEADNVSFRYSHLMGELQNAARFKNC